MSVPPGTGWATPGGDPGSGAPGYDYGPRGYEPPQATASPFGYGTPDGGWPKPGVIPLRPLSVGDILDGAVTVIRRYPRPTLAASAVVATVFALLGFGLQAARLGDAVGSTGRQLAQVAIFVGNQVAALLLSGFVTVVVGEAVLGRPLSLAEAWRRVRPRAWAIVGTTLLTALLTGLGLLTVIVGVYLFAAYALAVPVLLLEKTGVRASLKRSRALVRGAWWRTFGILLLTALLVSTITGVLLIPFLVVAGTGGGVFTTSASAAPTLGALVVLSLGQLVAQTLTLPFTAAVRALLYVDRRIRVEALDVAIRQAAAPQATT